MSTSMWLPLKQSEIGHDVPLGGLVEAYLDVSIALALAANTTALEHPGTGAELAELALASAIERRVSSGRGARIRAARAAGASWNAIAHALDVSEEAAQQEFRGWIDGQVWLYGREGIGLAPDAEAAARALVD